MCWKITHACVVFIHLCLSRGGVTLWAMTTGLSSPQGLSASSLQLPASWLCISGLAVPGRLLLSGSLRDVCLQLRSSESFAAAFECIKSLTRLREGTCTGPWPLRTGFRAAVALTGTLPGLGLAAGSGLGTQRWWGSTGGSLPRCSSSGLSRL